MADANLADVLEELEHTKHYSAWIRQMIAPHISGRILEVGAGRGTVLHLTSPTTDTSPRSSRRRSTVRCCASD